MKIRYGLVLAMAIGLGTAGCASGGGGGGGGMPPPSASAGERPRNNDNTRLAEAQLEAAEAAGMASEAQGFYEAALAAAEAGIAADPTNPLSHRQAAMASMGLGDYAAAGMHFDRAAELYPLYEFDDAGTRERAWIDLYNQASPLIGQADYEGAAALFESANAIYSGRPEAYLTLGQIYGQLRRHDDALENLDRAVEVINSEAAAQMDSATVSAWQELAADVPMIRAQVMSDAGRYEDAAAIFTEMIEADPTDTEAARNLAATYMQMGDEARAFSVYEDLMNQPGLAPRDLYQIGVGFYQGNDYGQAALAFGRSVEINPMDRDGLELWARSLQLDSAYADVPPVATRWAELDPYSQTALLIHAQSVNQTGDSQTAGELVQTIEGLEVHMNDLLISRYNNGGARVTGSVVNQSLDQGASVTLVFTFYTEAGDPMGTVTETVTVGAEGMAEVFQIDFDSSDWVGGYGYELTVG